MEPKAPLLDIVAHSPANLRLVLAQEEDETVGFFTVQLPGPIELSARFKVAPERFVRYGIWDAQALLGAGWLALSATLGAAQAAANKEPDASLQALQKELEAVKAERDALELRCLGIRV